MTNKRTAEEWARYQLDSCEHAFLGFQISRCGCADCREKDFETAMQQAREEARTEILEEVAGATCLSKLRRALGLGDE